MPVHPEPKENFLSQLSYTQTLNCRRHAPCPKSTSHVDEESASETAHTMATGLKKEKHPWLLQATQCNRHKHKKSQKLRSVGFVGRLLSCISRHDVVEGELRNIVATQKIQF